MPVFLRLPHSTAIALILLASSAPSSKAVESLPLPAISTQGAATQGPALPPAALDPNYQLGPGDQIEITVYGYEEYTGPKVVLPDGTITLPLVGQVQVEGQTLSSLTSSLTTQLSALVVEPAVTVSLATLRPVVVTVAGEVQRPGPVELRGLTTATSANRGTPGAALEAMPTLSSALMEAGGVTSLADIREIQVQRTGSSGEAQTISVNLWDAIWSEATPQDPILQDGDAVFVPRNTSGDRLDRRVLARSRLSPDTVQVRVVGEVTLPGEIAVTPDSSISSAVATAGGPTEDANLRRVELVRLSESGTIQREQIDLRNLIDEYQVQEGDVVFVPKGNTFSILDFAGRVLRPLGAVIDLINQF